jgi:hypothetical protein
LSFGDETRNKPKSCDSKEYSVLEVEISSAWVRSTNNSSQEELKDLKLKELRLERKKARSS